MIVKLPSYNARRRREYKCAAICLERGLFNCWTVVENKSFYVMNEIRKTGTFVGLTGVLAKIYAVLESWLTRAADSSEAIA